MAINKVVAPNSVPTNEAVARRPMMGFMTSEYAGVCSPTRRRRINLKALGSYIHGGTLLVESDETITEALLTVRFIEQVRLEWLQAFRV